MSGEGSTLEAAGWQQGVFVKDSDLPTLLFDAIPSFTVENGMVAIVASQSCDIACNDEVLAPRVELSVGRIITALDGNYTFNKNPRKLHLSFRLRTGDGHTGEEQYAEFKACEKVSILKTSLIGLMPNKARVIPSESLNGYVAWLAARYSRPALPTTFNDMIATADKKGKLKKHAKSGDKTLSGIYVKITPNTELEPGETYAVNLLGVVPVNIKNMDPAQESIRNIEAILGTAGMDVKSAVLPENKVSLALIKEYDRFYFDDLSFRNETPFPIETETSLS